MNDFWYPSIFGIKKGREPNPQTRTLRHTCHIWTIRHTCHIWTIRHTCHIWTIRHTCHKPSKKFWRKLSQRLTELVHYLQGTLWLWLSNYQTIRWELLLSVASVSAFGNSERRRCPRIFKSQWSEDVCQSWVQACVVPDLTSGPLRPTQQADAVH